MSEVGVFLFDGVEVLDFAAPFEVFSLARMQCGAPDLQVRAIASSDSVRARNRLQIEPAKVSYDSEFDALILPGGPGVNALLEGDLGLVDWIQRHAERGAWVMSICSGALLLAQAGLLRERTASTHRSDFEQLLELEPTARVATDRRYSVSDKIVTSAGISAGIDASLFLLSEMTSLEVAKSTADWMEYESTTWLPR